MTFAIGTLVGSLSCSGRPGAMCALRQPPLAWAVGVGGLFGYHALYFLALRFAPPAEAGLLNYLWPLLVVLFSSLLPGERLAVHHVVGALLGLAGTVLLLAGSASGFTLSEVPGLMAAVVAVIAVAAHAMVVAVAVAPGVAVVAVASAARAPVVTVAAGRLVAPVAVAARHLAVAGTPVQHSPWPVACDPPRDRLVLAHLGS